MIFLSMLVPILICLSAVFVGVSIGAGNERRVRSFSTGEDTFFSVLGRLERTVFICALLVLPSTLFGSFITTVAYEHKVTMHKLKAGQPLQASIIQPHQKYQVVPPPEGVIWIQAEDSKRIIAYKFKSPPPKQFISTEVDETGRKVFLSTNTNQDLLRNQKIHSGTK